MATFWYSYAFIPGPQQPFASSLVKAEHYQLQVEIYLDVAICYNIQQRRTKEGRGYIREEARQERDGTMTRPEHEIFCSACPHCSPKLAPRLLLWHGQGSQAPPFDTTFSTLAPSLVLLMTIAHECMCVLVPATTRTPEQISDGSSEGCNSCPNAG